MTEAFLGLAFFFLNHPQAKANRKARLVSAISLRWLLHKRFWAEGGWMKRIRANGIIDLPFGITLFILHAHFGTLHNPGTAVCIVNTIMKLTSFLSLGVGRYNSQPVERSTAVGFEAAASDRRCSATPRDTAAASRGNTSYYDKLYIPLYIFAIFAHICVVYSGWPWILNTVHECNILH